MSKRTDRTTGNYATEMELVEAVHLFKAQGMSQPEIGEACGISRATVSRIQNPPKKKEEHKPINLNTLWRIQPTEGEIRWL